MERNFEPRLIGRMKAYFGRDERRIKHALSVNEYSKMIMEHEGEADPEVVTPAAILHDIGIHAAEKKYGSSEGRYQELEGPPIAREIMLDEGLPERLIDEVCKIIKYHHTPGVVDTIDFKVVYDADQIAALESGEITDALFLTRGGVLVAKTRGITAKQ